MTIFYRFLAKKKISVGLPSAVRNLNSYQPHRYELLKYGVTLMLSRTWKKRLRFFDFNLTLVIFEVSSENSVGKRWVFLWTKVQSPKFNWSFFKYILPINFITRTNWIEVLSNYSTLSYPYCFSFANHHYDEVAPSLIYYYRNSTSTAWYIIYFLYFSILHIIFPFSTEILLIIILFYYCIISCLFFQLKFIKVYIFSF
jgi:hypothetical protein